jgi:hypothetical protein
LTQGQACCGSQNIRSRLAKHLIPLKPKTLIEKLRRTEQYSLPQCGHGGQMNEPRIFFKKRKRSYLCDATNLIEDGNFKGPFLQ